MVKLIIVMPVRNVLQISSGFIYRDSQQNSDVDEEKPCIQRHARAGCCKSKNRYAEPKQSHQQ